MLSSLKPTNVGAAENKTGTQMQHHSTAYITQGLN